MLTQIHRNGKASVSKLALALAALLCMDFFLATPARAQTSSKELLQAGMQQYDNAEFELVVATLQQALQTGLEKKEDVILAHKYLAFSYAATGEEQKAKLEFLKLLEIYPVFDLLLSESPKLRKPLELAKQEYVPKDTAPPIINFAPPTAVDENLAIPLSAEVTDVSGLESVVLFYKKASEQTFVAAPMIKGSGDTYSATIPAEAVTVDGMECYIQAKDKAGNEPASIGSAQKPLKIAVNLVDKDAPTIVHAPITTAQENADVLIEARITDRTGVKQAEIFYRKVGEAQFTAEKLAAKGEAEFAAKISAKLVTEAGVEYYLRANDATNPPALFGSAEKPFKIAVSIVDKQSPVIEHETIASSKENVPLRITATVTDRSDVAKVILFYKRVDAEDFVELKMTETAANQYLAEIPREAITPAGLAYYLEARDALQNPPAYQGTAEKPLLVKVTRVDSEPPTIVHTPINEALAGEKITLTAVATDNVGVAEVRLFYRGKGSVEYRPEKMTSKPANAYEAKIEARLEAIEYYVWAQDVSGNAPSLRMSPDTAHLITVKAKPEPVAVAKKGSKKWLWIGLGSAAIGGGVFAVTSMGGKESVPPPTGDSKLPNPPTKP